MFKFLIYWVGKRMPFNLNFLYKKAVLSDLITSAC